MGKKRLWVSSANHDEKGSFCDTSSQHHYNNVDAFTAESQMRAAGERGDEAIPVDAPADGTDSYGVDQRFNLWHSEQDDQGTDTSAKHRAGGR